MKKPAERRGRSSTVRESDEQASIRLHPIEIVRTAEAVFPVEALYYDNGQVLIESNSTRTRERLDLLTRDGKRWLTFYKDRLDGTVASVCDAWAVPDLQMFASVLRDAVQNVIHPVTQTSLEVRHIGNHPDEACRMTMLFIGWKRNPQENRLLTSLLLHREVRNCFRKIAEARVSTNTLMLGYQQHVKLLEDHSADREAA